MKAKRYVGFDQSAVNFLTELAANNNREWFRLNKSRYEELVLDPALTFIQSMQQPLDKIAPHFTAIPTRVGGSLMRVYRDTRFSRDKLPYKTNIGIQFRHEDARNVHAPGYYVHIEPGSVFIGAGMWRPDADPLREIRQRIAEQPAQWRCCISDPSFARHFSLGGDSLQRPPRGFAATHDCIDDIKRKSFIAVKKMSVEDCISSRFQQKVETAFVAAEPFMRFLCKSVGVRF